MSFSITKAAVKKAFFLMEKEGTPDYILRIGVKGGGCSGFSYVLKFDKETKEDDIVIESNGLTIACDPKSIEYLEGIEVDYETNLLKAGFRFNNPTARRSCSCGESFSV